MNKKRAKVGILFYFSSQWMGGIIYVINLVKTLGFLDDEKKPEIYLFYKPELKKFLNEFDYPYLKTIEWKFPSIIEGNIKSLLLRKNIFIDKILENYKLDALFPLHDFPLRTRTDTKLVSWWADLQHKYYPEFFTRSQNLSRDIRTRLIIRNCDDLVVSSNDVLNDFNKFYRMRKGLNVHVFHFVSVIDDLKEVNIDDLRTKYGLPEQYFLISNQFHKHKNHRVLLQTLALLKGMGISKHMAFTGKFPSAAGSPYLAELHELIEKNQLNDQVTMLGVISRNEQLQLMRHSQAVIQPSLFEGWSTVIEDAKSLQVPVIAANLRVNIEQLGDDGCYFDPHDPDALAAILKDYPARNMNDIFYEPYEERVRAAAETLMEIFSNKGTTEVNQDQKA